jgi:hypothetical protein
MGEVQYSVKMRDSDESFADILETNIYVMNIDFVCACIISNLQTYSFTHSLHSAEHFKHFTSPQLQRIY